MKNTKTKLEIKFEKYLNHCSSVKEFQQMKINYYNPVYKKWQNYSIYAILTNKGETRLCGIIKSYKDTLRPYDYEPKYLKLKYIINYSKWSSAKKLADNNNIRFSLFTEDFFNSIN